MTNSDRIRPHLKDMTLAELKRFCEEQGEKAFRAKQIFRWIAEGVDSYAEMTDLPKALREKLERVSSFTGVETEIVQRSKEDGTVKFLFSLEDGNRIESVFMKYKYGNTLCISSQAGCRMGCIFCASTLNGLERNLTAGEMIDQILQAEKETGEKISHIVVMGTGEPFENYENLAKFIEIIHDPAGKNISRRNITVSTCGIVPMIERFGTEYPQVNLAISLHAATNEQRGKMMPINRKYPLETLIPACRDHVEKTGRRITFEYALVKGKNDSREDMERLSRLLRGINCHVNLIPLNEVTETGMKGTARKTAAKLAEVLEESGVAATVRRELGTDIDGACGQLRLGQAAYRKKQN